MYSGTQCIHARYHRDNIICRRAKSDKLLIPQNLPPSSWYCWLILINYEGVNFSSMSTTGWVSRLFFSLYVYESLLLAPATTDIEIHAQGCHSGHLTSTVVTQSVPWTGTSELQRNEISTVVPIWNIETWWQNKLSEICQDYYCSVNQVRLSANANYYNKCLIDQPGLVMYNIVAL